MAGPRKPPRSSTQICPATAASFRPTSIQIFGPISALRFRYSATQMLVSPRTIDVCAHDVMYVSNKTAYTRAATLCLLVVVMVVLFRPAVQSLFPLGNNLEPSGDDWWTYHRYAVSVLHD